MSPEFDAPHSLTALQDLVGVCRALYVDWTCSGADSLDLEELAQVGLELAHALRLARGTAPNTVGRDSAWVRAEAATERLGALVAKTDEIASRARREEAHADAKSAAPPSFSEGLA